MNTKTITGLIIAIIVLGAATLYLVGNKTNLSHVSGVASPAPQRQDIPTRLIIPKLHIDAKVESVGLNKFNGMDVPQGIQNVGWYNLGYRPGEVGNAVMAGHLDDIHGSPAVFFHLKDLQVGDDVISESIGPDSKAKDIHFKVALIETYKYNEVPMQQVFGDFPIARLNLITCGGSWDNVTKNYSNRTVVYTRLADN